MGGSFDISVDGDLFKATITFLEDDSPEQKTDEEDGEKAEQE